MIPWWWLIIAILVGVLTDRLLYQAALQEEILTLKTKIEMMKGKEEHDRAEPEYHGVNHMEKR